LSAADLAILRVFALKTRAQMTRELFKMLPFAFPGCCDKSEAEVDSRAAFLSGITPRLYDCCPRSCCCYVGPHADLTHCPYCKEPRLNSQGRPRKVFTYIPLIPRLLALCRDRETAELMSYQLSRPYCPQAINDVFDGRQYRALCDTRVSLNGQEQPYHHFSNPRDIALGLSTDGFTPFKRGKQT
ncbi:hypothetical protein BC629DRAFT_1250904, partial [Irpex lacteus]